MSKWKIYSKTGVERAVADSLQYNGTRMGERFLTVTVKSASPISFAVGDYIMYRNEKFEINYEPTLLKKAASGKYGEGFTYNDIKFNSLADELVRCDFCDIVLEESQEASQVHYTGLPEFGFFAETVDDLLDRIQANLDSIYPAPVDVAFFESLSPEDAITTYLSLGTPFTYNGLPVQMGTTVVSGTDILICKKPNGDFMMFQLVNYEPDWETNRRYHYTGNVSASDTSVAEYFANSDKIDTSSKHWVILSPDYERSKERGATDAEWNQYFVEGSEYTYGTTRKMVSVSNQNCWDALTLCYDTFKEPFIIHGRVIIVGSNGNIVSQNFHYGKGNGLYEIERNADSSQEIITYLKAYGTTQNVPYKYYAMRYGIPYAEVDVNSIVTKQILGWGTTYTFAVITNEIASKFPEALTGDDVKFMFIGITPATYLKGHYVLSAGSYAQARIDEHSRWGDLAILFRRGDFGDWKSNLPGTSDDDWIFATENWGRYVSTWAEEQSESGKIYFYRDVNKYKCPYTAIASPGTQSTPTQMDVMNLMLPGFPDISVYDWVKVHGATNTDDNTGRATWNGKTAYFSQNRLLPYVKSLEADNIGVRAKSETFDGSNDKEEIYPTISEETIGDLHDAGYDTAAKGWTDVNQRIDTVQMRSEYLVTDDGFVYESDEDGKQKKTKDATTGEIIDFKDTFFIDLPFLGFDLKKAIEDAGADCQLSVIDGKLGGREFTIKNVDDDMYQRGGKYYWKVECERIQDTGIGLWFPYASYNFSIENTDHYVLLGINLPDSYVDAAATRLLKAALIFLDNNDETRYVIQPRIDELFMARNHDAVVAQREENPSDDSKSIYEVIEEGTIFNIDDPDFGEYHLPIQQLTIKEYGNGSIPTFDVTLMEEPQTSSIQKQVDEAVNTAVREGGWTATGIKNMIASYGSNLFLSKNNNDTASGEIGFLKGLWIKTKGLFGFDADGNIKGNDIDAAGDVTARSLKSTGSSGNTTADIDNSTQKNLGLEVAESGVIGGILRVAKNILTKTIQSLNFYGGDSLFGTGWQLTDDYGNGRSRLVVDDAVFRGKVTMNELEVRKLTAMGGNYVFSPAASIIEEVDYFKFTRDEETGDITGEELLGYEYVKVPWVLRLIPLSLIGRYLSRKKWVRSTMSDEDLEDVDFYRCWLKADDGSTQTINTWRIGMLARCQTFDTSQIEHGTQDGTYSEGGQTWTGKNVTNKLYWRAVVDTKEGVDKSNYDKTTVALNDGRKHNYIDLANCTDADYQDIINIRTESQDTGYDIPLYWPNEQGSTCDHVSAGDNIVCFGDWKHLETSHLNIIETVGDDAPAFKELKGIGYSTAHPQQEINWSLDGKVGTKISPTTGNRFISPEFIIEATGEKLYNEHIKSTFDIGGSSPLPITVRGFESDYSQSYKDGAYTGDALLIPYNNITDDAIDICEEGVSPEHAGASIWGTYNVKEGESYLNTKNGHLYVATATGWEDRGLVNESQSSLKVDINGISAVVNNPTTGVAALNIKADGITSQVKAIKAGKNLLTGVLTGNGWKSATYEDELFEVNNDAGFDTDGEWISPASGDTLIVTPAIAIPKRGLFTFSFYIEGSQTVRIALYQTGAALQFKSVSGNGRVYATTELNAGTYYLVVEASKIRHAQVEMADNLDSLPTAFEASTTEVSSRITQTADGIEASVKKTIDSVNIFNGLNDGRGWTYGVFSAADIYFRTKLNVEQGGTQVTKITSPYNLLDAGKHAVSFYSAAHGLQKDYTVEIKDDSSTPVTLFSASTANNTLLVADDDAYATANNRKRYYFVFELSSPKNVSVIFGQTSNGMYVPTEMYVYRPMLNKGEYLSAFGISQTTNESYAKMTADEIDLSVKNDYQSAGLKIVPSGLQLKGGKVDFVGSDETPYIKVSVDTNGMPHFIFMAPDGVTEMYDLGYTGLRQLVNNSVPDEYVGGNILSGYIVSENIYPWEDESVINPAALLGKESELSDHLGDLPVWLFNEGYTIAANHQRIYNWSATSEPSDYDGAYLEDNTPTQQAPGSLPADGWYFTRIHYEGNAEYTINLVYVEDGHITQTVPLRVWSRTKDPNANARSWNDGYWQGHATSLYYRVWKSGYPEASGCFGYANEGGAVVGPELLIPSI